MTQLISVWVLCTCFPGEDAPCLPEVFGTYAEAHAAFRQAVHEEWDRAEVASEGGEPSDLPEDPAQAHEILAALNGPGWGRWRLDHHWMAIQNPKPRLAGTFLIANTSALDEETGEPLWWSNEDGWGALATACVASSASAGASAGPSTWPSKASPSDRPSHPRTQETDHAPVHQAGEARALRRPLLAR